MNNRLLAAACVAAMALPGGVWAQGVTLKLANPQPSTGSLSKGLAVSYAKVPGDTRELSQVRKAIAKAKPGEPLKGLSYDDTPATRPALTSDRKQLVGAAISGYIKFDRAGAYTLDFLNNDGLELFIGGEQVADYDGVHACGYAGEVEVNVPQVGYYEVEAVYFQRKGTSCLMMEWGPDSDGLEQVPDSAFFH
ncbi:MAG: PA14 domain-containing protein [Pseudomonadota bacterium]